MNIFGKNEDYLDIPALQKKGLVRLPEPKVDKSMKMNADGYVEFIDDGLSQDSTSSVNNDSSLSSNPMACFFGDNSSVPQAPTMPSGGGTSFQSFWDAPVNTSTPSTSYFDNSANSSSSSSYSSTDIDALKTKIENIEQKLDRILERLRY